MKFFIFLILVINTYCTTLLYGQSSSDYSFCRELVKNTPDDTLKFRSFEIFKAKPVIKPTIQWNKQRLLGIGIMVACSVLSYYFHHEAEAAYNDYLKTGNIKDMDRLFQKAKCYDRYNGWTYIGIEIGFIIMVLSFK